jgi:hypothetical protein
MQPGPGFSFIPAGAHAGDGVTGPGGTLGVPAYFYPWPGSQAWKDVSRTHSPTILIMNPMNGPGVRVDSNYTAALAGLRTRGLTLYGYVDTDYGARLADTIVAEAETYRTWYRAAGIFLDQTAPTAEHLDYYGDITTRLHAAGFEVAMNPGQPAVDRRYLDLVEHVVNFEGTYGLYLTQAFPPWIDGYPPAKMWHLVYEVPSRSAMDEVLTLARRRRAGVVYVTDRSMPNPWDGLPAFWDAERR